MWEETAARGLGWAGIAIGAAEIAAPQRLERMLGVGNGRTTGVLRALGVREIGHGIDILSHRDPTPGVWSRVAGDVLDGILLAVAGMKTRNPRGLAMVAAMVAGIALADLLAARQLSRRKEAAA